jgi:hypothetical protein
MTVYRRCTAFTVAMLMSFHLYGCHSESPIHYSNSMLSTRPLGPTIWEVDVEILPDRKVKIVGDMYGVIQLTTTDNDLQLMVVGSHFNIKKTVEVKKGVWADKPEMYGVMFNEDGPIAGAMSAETAWSLARSLYWSAIKDQINARGLGRVPTGAFSAP